MNIQEQRQLAEKYMSMTEAEYRYRHPGVGLSLRTVRELHLRKLGEMITKQGKKEKS